MARRVASNKYNSKILDFISSFGRDIWFVIGVIDEKPGGLDSEENRARCPIDRMLLYSGRDLGRSLSVDRIHLDTAVTSMSLTMLFSPVESC